MLTYLYLFIITNPVANLEGIVDNVVVGEGDSLGFTSSPRGELDIARGVHLDVVSQILDLAETVIACTSEDVFKLKCSWMSSL